MEGKDFKSAMQFATGEIHSLVPKSETEHLERIIYGSILEVKAEELENELLAARASRPSS